MPTYNLRGINVDFPFEAYECQLVYMEKVIQALQTKSNALLESPTGTGKTLCLLCATLAWRKSLGPFSTGGNRKSSSQVPRRDSDSSSFSQWRKTVAEFSGGGSQNSSQVPENNLDVSPASSETTNLPTIVYTSRTHSQLRQVIQELKRSNYRPKMVILGSREQLCIHEEVSLLRGKAQNNACRFLCKKNLKKGASCSHVRKVTEYVAMNPHIGDEPIDIEDLSRIGRKSGACPYYISRELHKDVDILFAPYNYLIDPGNRKSLTLDWNNSILIFDEAHNLESLCADAASFDLPSGLLTACISEAQTCIDLAATRRHQSGDESEKPDHYAILRALFLKLEQQIAEVPINSKELGFTKPGHYIYKMLADLNITSNTSSKLIDTIDKATVLLEEDRQLKKKDTSSRLENFKDILKQIFVDEGNAYPDLYRVHVQELETNASHFSRGKSSRTLSWWCFSPGIAMQVFAKKGVGSIILTSGTLSPMESFAQELKLNFPIRLENPHVISSNQLWAGVVPVGPSGRAFNSSYRNRDSLEYKQELGNAIVNFARIVPDGLLIFFPSYYMLDQSIECWKSESPGNSIRIWDRICKHKKPVIEPRQSSLFSASIETYMATLKDSSISGAIFFAVCRGKVSEGLDFADHAGRAVVITGLPFATLTEPKVRLKREFLDQQLSQIENHKSAVLTGEEWYGQQASRAVNQAIGRVIRHRHDYGAIIFCDERFAQPNRQSQVSRWIQPYIKSYSKFGDVVSTLTRFFRDAKQSRNLVKCPTRDEIEVEAARNVDEFPELSLMNNDYPIDSSISPMEDKRGQTSSQLKDYLPANCSTLPEGKQAAKLKFSGITFIKDNKKLISGREDRQDENIRTSVTYDSLMGGNLRKEEMSALCSHKKRKVVDLGHDSVDCYGISQEHLSAGSLQSSNPFTALGLVKKNKSLKSLDGKVQSGEEISSLLVRRTHVGQIKQEDVSIRQESKGVQTSAASSSGSEARGSAYLAQVGEKLNATEYKQFIECLKGLKSKALKISEVLQSIVQLFSGVDRHHLLQRFKDYVPAKYHLLYDQYMSKETIDISDSE